MSSLFDGVDGFHGDAPARQRHSRTSVAAADGIAPVAGRLRALVYAHLVSCGEAGSTDEEGIEALGMSPSTYRPRRCECVEAGMVCDSGKTRLTKSKRKAVVWQVVTAAAQVTEAA